MFIHNISPILLQIGPLAIRWYSLVYLIGFVLAYYILVRQVKRGTILNLTRERVDSYVLYLILAIIIGARLFEILIWEPGYYFSNPGEMIAIWHGGLSFHGGLVGAAIITFWYCKKHEIQFYDLADTLALPAALMLGFGRIANFINGELAGHISNVSWAINFRGETNTLGELVYRHPSQLYESFKNFLVFGILGFAKNFKLPRGVLFWLFVTLYGFGRFIADLWRDGTPVFLGLSVGQIMNLLMGIGGSIMVWYVGRSK